MPSLPGTFTTNNINCLNAGLQVKVSSYLPGSIASDSFTPGVLLSSRRFLPLYGLSRM
jgi:hypothetical protein